MQENHRNTHHSREKQQHTCTHILHRHLVSQLRTGDRKSQRPDHMAQKDTHSRSLHVRVSIPRIQNHRIEEDGREWGILSRPEELAYVIQMEWALELCGGGGGEPDVEVDLVEEDEAHHDSHNNKGFLAEFADPEHPDLFALG